MTSDRSMFYASRDKLATVGYYLAGLWMVVGALLLTVWVNHVRLGRLELLHEEVTLENVLLSRRLEEYVNESRSRFDRQDCQIDLAVSGFRMGHMTAYQFMKRGLLGNCVTPQQSDAPAAADDE